ncbi:MAG: hypothetical protein ABI690_33380 [Chloroflexota bacterium]
MLDRTPTTPNLANHALLIGIDLLCLVVATLVVASLLLLLGFSDLEYSILAAVLITAGIAWYGVWRFFSTQRIRVWMTHLVVVTLIFTLATVLASQWLDTTRDGQGYHSEAILSLAEGWNPYRTDAPANTIYPEWTGLFSKGAWVNAAVLYRLTGNVEAGKAFSMVLLLASLAVAYATFKTQPNLPARHAAILSFLLAFNPVSVYQLFSFYVDGQLASCLVILVCLLLLLARHFDRLLLLALCMVALYIVNVKLNGAIYLSLLLGGYVLWLWMQRRAERWWVLGSLIVTGLIAVGLVGYNPYISQYVREFLATGNPFYPTQWYELIQIDINTPVGLLNQNRWTRLALSILSQSQVGLEPGTLKIPFFIFPQELLNFRYPDTRLGGFGPFFSGGLILTAIIALAWLWRQRNVFAHIRSEFRQMSSAAFPGLIVFLLLLNVLISDQGWWARYAPQLWMLPVLTAALALSSSLVWVRRSALALVFTLFINVVLIVCVYVALGVLDQSTLRQDLTQLQVQSVTTPIEVNFNRMPMTQWRFERWNIAYRVTPDLPVCAEGQKVRNVVYSLSIVCGDG